MAVGIDNEKGAENVTLTEAMANVTAQLNSEEYEAYSKRAAKRPRSLNRRIKRLLRDEYNRREYGFSFIPLRRIAVAAVICVLTFAMTFNVGAMREGFLRFAGRFWNASVELFDVFLDLGFESRLKNPPEFIEVKKEPRDIPAEWTREVSLDIKGCFSILYMQDENIILTYSQTIIDGSSDSLDNEFCSIETVAIGNGDGLLLYYFDDETYSLIWSDGEYKYSLYTFDNIKIGKEQLLEIAGSVR